MTDEGATPLCNPDMLNFLTTACWKLDLPQCQPLPTRACWKVMRSWMPGLQQSRKPRRRPSRRQNQKAKVKPRQNPSLSLTPLLSLLLQPKQRPLEAPVTKLRLILRRVMNPIPRVPLTLPPQATTAVAAAAVHDCILSDMPRRVCLDYT